MEHVGIDLGRAESQISVLTEARITSYNVCYTKLLRQSVGGVAGQLAEIVQYGLPLDEWARSMQELATITPDQATKAARDP